MAIKCAVSGCREDLIARSSNTRNWLIGILILMALAFSTKIGFIDNRINACAKENDIANIAKDIRQIAKDMATIQKDVAVIKEVHKSTSNKLEAEEIRSKKVDMWHLGEMEKTKERMRELEKVSP